MAPAGVPRGPWRLHVVPHTHWDREWWQPVEAFRIRLAHTIDEVLDVLEADERMCFTLDGQSVILEDYAEYRPDPESRERLRALAADGRLDVGPAYVQPDELLAGPEALVRNLLIGAAVCRRHGIEPALVGYAPDAFGHPSQMPQILLGFGIDHLIFSRGAETDRAAMWWVGPDGSRILGVPLSGGYWNASSLGLDRDGHAHWIDDPAEWPEAAAERVRNVLRDYGPGHLACRLRDVLLCNGVDHRRIQRNLPEMLAACAERIPGSTYAIGRFGDYVAALREQAGELRLPVVRGELLSGRFHQITRSVNSTRMELKQLNHDVERLLRSSETLAALATFRDGTAYPRQELELAWRRVLRAQPHDSIAGCSVDEVARDMRHRYDNAREIAERLGQEALVALSGEGRDAVWHYAGAPLRRRTLVNVLPWPRREPAELALPEDLHGEHDLVARTPAGDLPVQRLADGRGLVIAEVPAFGSLTLDLAAGAAPVDGAARVAAPRALENGLLRVTVAGNGTLTLTDRRTGTRWAGLGLFEDEADRGDSYTFCPLEGDHPWTSAGEEADVRVVERGPLRAELEVRLALHLPSALSHDRRRRIGHATCPVTMRVRLDAGADRVEVSTRFVNRASDHRLRVRFPDRTGDRERVRAQSQFAVAERPAQPEPHPDWFEPPSRTHHTAGLVRAGELCVLARGLPEYEALPRRGKGVDLALTLVRSVGWLSRDDLTTRRGGAGPALPTPDAQGLGHRHADYALTLRGGRGDADLVRAMEDYRHPIADGPGRIDLGGVLEVTGDRFGATALKAAEDGDGVILRVYNPERARASVRVSGAVSGVERCRLDETGGAAVDGAVELGPYEIVTLRVRPSGAAADPRSLAAARMPGRRWEPGDPPA